MTNHLDHGNVLMSLNCPFHDHSAPRVPEMEIRCAYETCIAGIGVAGGGLCWISGDPRQADCPVYRRECPDCQGDGGWNGERATCKRCGGMGWIQTGNGEG